MRTARAGAAAGGAGGEEAMRRSGSRSGQTRPLRTRRHLPVGIGDGEGPVERLGRLTPRRDNYNYQSPPRMQPLHLIDRQIGCSRWRAAHLAPQAASSGEARDGTGQRKALRPPLCALSTGRCAGGEAGHQFTDRARSCGSNAGRTASVWMNGGAQDPPGAGAHLNPPPYTIEAGRGQGDVVAPDGGSPHGQEPVFRGQGHHGARVGVEPVRRDGHADAQRPAAHGEHRAEREARADVGRIAVRMAPMPGAAGAQQDVGAVTVTGHEAGARIRALGARGGSPFVRVGTGHVASRIGRELTAPGGAGGRGTELREEEGRFRPPGPGLAGDPGGSRVQMGGEAVGAEIGTRPRRRTAHPIRGSRSAGVAFGSLCGRDRGGCGPGGGGPPGGAGPLAYAASFSLGSG